jgi:hypothetical protein
MNDTLIHACEMFLVPTTILFIAFALAPTEGLKVVISAVGVLTSVIWAFHILFWTGILTSVDFATTLILSLIFLFAWVIAAYPHARSWRFGPERL